MALTGSLVWEARTTGADTNGGAFDPGPGTGTDYSTQDTPILSVADGAATGTTNLSSATGGFTAAMVNNTLQITGGTLTAGIYLITAFVDANDVTLDRSPGTGSGSTVNVGGGCASPGFVFGKWVGSNTLYVKRGTYTMANSANVSGGFCRLVVSGTDKLPNRMYGYDTNRTTTNTDTGPTFKPSAANTSLILNDAGASFLVYNINGDANGQSNCTFFNENNAPSIAENCTATGFTTGFLNQFSNDKFINCVAKSCTSSGFGLRQTGTNVIGCVADSCGGAGSSQGGFINNGVSCAQHTQCIARNCTGAGFFASTPNGSFYQCTADNTAVGGVSTGSGFKLTDLSWCLNCISSNNARWGFETDQGTLNFFARLYNCAGYNNTSGNVDATFDSIGFVALTANPYTNAAGGDYSLNTTAGGGAAARAAGFIQVYPGISTSSFFDIGAVQNKTTSTPGTYVTITSSADPSTPGQSVTFMAAVTVVGGGTATGTIQFAIDGTAFGSAVALAGGSAVSGATSTLTNGAHTITGTYTPSGSFQSSVGTLIQVVTTPATKLAIGRLFRKPWLTDPMGFAQELAALVNADPSLTAAQNQIRVVLPQVTSK